VEHEAKRQLSDAPIREKIRRVLNMKRKEDQACKTLSGVETMGVSTNFEIKRVSKMLNSHCGRSMEKRMDISEQTLFIIQNSCMQECSTAGVFCTAG